MYTPNIYNHMVGVVRSALHSLPLGNCMFKKCISLLNQGALQGHILLDHLSDRIKLGLYLTANLSSYISEVTM